MLEQSWNPIQEYIFKWYPILAKSKVLASIPINKPVLIPISLSQ